MIDKLKQFDALILVSLIWFLAKFVRYAFPPLFGPLQSAYGVSNSILGTAFTSFMIIYALMQFPSGVIADSIGSIRVVAAGVAVAGVGALSLFFDLNFGFLIAAMLVIGAGTGVHKTVAIRLITRIYSNRPGRALGIHDTFGSFGGVAAPSLVVVFLSAPASLSIFFDIMPESNWRGVFLLTGIAGLFLSSTFIIQNRRKPFFDTDGATVDSSNGSSTSLLDYVTLFSDARFVVFVIATTGFSFAHNGLVAFLPLYLSQVSELSNTTASLLYSIFFWVTFVQLLTGDISDRFGRMLLMAIMGVTATAAMWGIVFLPNAGIVLLGSLIAFVGVGAHGFQPIRGAYLMNHLPDHLSGGGLGIVRTLLMGIGALAPVIVGITADILNFRVAFGVLAAVVAVSTIGLIGLWVVEK